MAEFKLGRIRFVWKGDWTTATTYYIDDVVRYGGRTYICQIGHTASADFNTDLEISPTKWNQMSDGTDWKGNWTTGTFYKINDVVKYGALVYVCNDSHTSAATTALGLEADQSKWTLFATGIDWKNDWAINTRYKVKDLVRYGGYTYVCNEGHTSAATTTLGLEADSSKWDTFNPGLEYKGTWANSTRYKLNDVVKYGAGLWICTTQHTSGLSFSPDIANWGQFVKGFEFESDWNIATTYQPGDIVRYGGNQYIAKTVHSGSQPSTAGSDWDLFSEGFNFLDAYNGSTAYKPGDIVSLNGYTYLAKLDSTGQEPPNATYWHKLNEGISWQGEWQNSTAYKLGDAVRFGQNVYICVLAHTSADDDSATTGDVLLSPNADITGTYWNLLVAGSETSVLTTKGDLVYYGGAGPTRLPIGEEGMVLRAGSEYPEWVRLGAIDYTYFVAPSGTDLPAPIWGKSFDKPWKTIRYACEQIENGPRNPNAKMLLEMNRAFIQREVTEWIQYQITNGILPFTISFVYEDYKCERDVGFMIDALIHDIGHGGNVKTRGVANALVGAITEDSPGAYPNISAEKEESIAAYNYMLTVIENILDQEAPATNYQTTNGDNSTSVVSQYFDGDLEAESGVLPTITSLVTIVTNALDDEDASRVPARYAPNNLVKIATGSYEEVLPIRVPAETCLLGDELRSTKVKPRAGTTAIQDAKYSIGALNRLESVIGDIVLGNDVTETSGNTATQSRNWPFADTTESTNVKRLVRSILHNIDYRLGTTYDVTLTDPTGYNTSFLNGYGDARKLIKENKAFFQAEVVAYLTANYATLKYSKTKCKRDVGYIVDAMVYDLSYGGFYQSLNAGLSYYEGSTLNFDTSEKTATLAVYGYLKTIMAAVSQNTTVSALQSTVAQYRDTAGSAGSATFIQDNIDIIIDIITNGNNSAPNVTVTTISSNLCTTSTNHGLQTGDSFTPRSTSNGFTSGVKYWIVDAPNLNEFTVSTTYGGSTATLTNGSGLSIIGDVIDYPSAVDASIGAELVDASEALDSQQENLVTATTNYISANYPSLTYDSTKCQRDTRLILEAMMFDIQFSSNFATRVAAYAYLRGNASDVYTLGQKTATRAAYENLKETILGDTATYLDSSGLAETSITSLFALLDDIIYTGSLEGSTCATSQRNADYAVLQIERNRDYIVSEINAYIADTYSDTATAATTGTDVITISNTSWLERGTAVRFASAFGGLTANTTYYVFSIVNSTTFKVATTRTALTAFGLTNDSGSVAVNLVYDSALCTRDINSYLDALKFDMKYPGNYASIYSARFYANSVLGSLEEDMYYLRNNTGVRDMTLDGLTGDLLAPNAYGTSRVSAGAYCSLDPGWGPDDFRTWIIERSPYVQGVSTFGYAAIGQKIDGDLHNGGNDSIVSNDFTQVISDGIGAWVTNNGRAELVSVFTYYSHIGYLSENGGRIRGTNGNNSYGDFGSVAEGFDSRETPGTAVVDNKFQFTATIDSVFTSSSALYQFEFGNAGVDYTEVTYAITGGGISASVVTDEYRDDGVYQVRLLDLGDDSSGQFGGDGYLTSANTAQAGTLTQITLAQTDQQLSTAYPGMRITITGGTGVGQYAIINTYNAGTKIATVLRDSDGQAGWDHMVVGTTIAAPDASSTYTIEPRLTFSAPTFTDSLQTLSASDEWYDAVYGETSAVYTGLTGTYGGTGTGATFQVIRNGWKYIPTVTAGGLGYTRLETITIAGTSLGGLTSDNDLVITITAVNSVTGAILEFDWEGYGSGGVFVAVAGGAGSTLANSSPDGINWTGRTLPSGDWRSVAHGVFDDGSTVSKVSRFVALSYGSNTAAWSETGLTWTSATLPATANWISSAYGNGRFVAIASNSTTVAISDDGEIWGGSGSLNSTGFTSVAYGKGVFVAVKAGSTTASYSTNGISWTDVTLPASSNWVSVTFGKNIFVAVADDSNSGAYSIDGKTNWVTFTIGDVDGSSTAGYQKVRYGQGLFMATTYISGVEDYHFVATSEDGIHWSARGVDGINGESGYSALAFGNPQRTGYWIAINHPTEATDTVTRIRTGARAKARAFVAEEKIFSIRIVEPGSGYDSTPTMTITDPNNVYEAPHSVRTGSGVLAQPTWTNRGTGYQTGSAQVDTGDGYADFYQAGSFVAVRRLSERPVAGSNVVFTSLPNRVFKLVNIFTFRGTNDGAYTGFLQISPELEISEAPEHLDGVTTRIRYSQVRLTGHDFLDIGTGNFTETNYPGTPTQDPIPANETVEGNGGRVFFTSTDQDGNFRVGDLFAIEQSTGIATLNADAFNISGLQELTLGNVTLGGGSATITEFSTDPFFTQDSDNVVPTQRAIKAYIASQIGGGGASLNVNSVTAGSIYIAGSQITHVTSGTITMDATFNFKGGVTGYPLAFNYFLV